MTTGYDMFDFKLTPESVLILSTFFSAILGALGLFTNQMITARTAKLQADAQLKKDKIEEEKQRLIIKRDEMELLRQEVERLSKRYEDLEKKYSDLEKKYQESAQAKWELNIQVQAQKEQIDDLIAERTKLKDRVAELECEVKKLKGG